MYHTNSLYRKRKLTSPNGQHIAIWSDSQNDYVQLAHIYKSLGYNGKDVIGSTFGLVFKNKIVHYFYKKCCSSAAYVMNINDVIPSLKKFLDILYVQTPSSETSNGYRIAIADNAIKEATALIDFFRSEVFGEASNVKTTKLDASINNDNENNSHTTPEPSNDSPVGAVNSTPSHLLHDITHESKREVINMETNERTIESTMTGISVRLSASLKADIDDLAKATRSDVSSLIIQLVEILVNANKDTIELYRELAAMPLVMPHYNENKTNSNE